MEDLTKILVTIAPSIVGGRAWLTMHLPDGSKYVELFTTMEDAIHASNVVLLLLSHLKGVKP